MAEVSARYAAALFELAVESGNPEEYLNQAALVKDTMAHDESERAILDPTINSRDKKRFLETVFEGKLNGDMLGFLCVAAEQNREEFIVAALTELENMINAHLGRITAEVVAASPLDEGQLEQLKTVLSKKLNKEVEILVKIDTSVIGGLSIRADGFYSDNTIAARLSHIKNQVRGIPNDA